MTKYTEKKTSLESQLETDPANPDSKKWKQEHVAAVEKLASIEDRWLELHTILEKEGALEQQQQQQQ
jgi:hypothetical protein